MKLSKSEGKELKATTNEDRLQHFFPSCLDGPLLWGGWPAREVIDDHKFVQPIIFSQSQREQEFEECVGFRH